MPGLSPALQAAINRSREKVRTEAHEEVKHEEKMDTRSGARTEGEVARSQNQREAPSPSGEIKESIDTIAVITLEFWANGVKVRLKNWEKVSPRKVEHAILDVFREIQRQRHAHTARRKHGN